MLKQLRCPACNAPLDYDGKAATLACPYCDTKVVVPVDWRGGAAPDGRASATIQVGIVSGPIGEQLIDLLDRGEKTQAIKLFRETYGGSLQEAKDAIEALSMAEPLLAAVQTNPTPPSVRGTVYDLHQPPKQRSGCIFVVVLVAVVAIIGSALFAVFGAQTAQRLDIDAVMTVAVEQLALDDLSQNAQQIASELADAPAVLIGRFGGEGIGPGKFEDARAIALDNAGKLFVADYTSGRVQVFAVRDATGEASGEYVDQWKITDEYAYVDQFSADRNGALYIPVGGELRRYDGTTGEVLDTLPPLDADSFFGGYDDSVVVGADGALYAVWDGDIVRIDAGGAVTLRIEDAIESAVGGLETTTNLAVDGRGDIYALGESQDVLVKFDANGRFVDRIATAERGSGDDPAKLRAAGALAVDSKGRVYVSDIFGIKVYDAGGQYLHTIDTPSYAYGQVISDDDILFVAAGTEVLAYQLRP